MLATLRLRPSQVVRPRLNPSLVRLSPRRWQYNGSSSALDAPHTTYFQQPPQQPPKRSRRILRSILMSSFWFMAGAVFMAVQELNEQAELLQNGEDGDLEVSPADAQMLIGESIKIALQHSFAIGGVALDLSAVDTLLSTYSDFTVSEKAIGHVARLPCNIPCEDFVSCSSFGLHHDPKRDWAEWSIYDGHAGPRTAHDLSNTLRTVLALSLAQGKCIGRPFVPNDPHIHRIIKRTFLEVDNTMINDAAAQIESDEADRAIVVSRSSIAHSGSCALMALFDPANSVLRVANVGDSRAVLGRWDPVAERYVAQLMSDDHTGFNPGELERLRREHPDEDVIDPETGRIFGLAVTRAFGDARWKWPASVTKRAHEIFWGPAPRPDDVVKTPPYLTAEPEITETRIDCTSKHADFLIVASDGLWDNMTSDDAISCVQMWLDKNRPDNFLDPKTFEQQQLQQDPAEPNTSLFGGGGQLLSSRTPIGDKSDWGETYWDLSEKALKWKVSPKHFVVEDLNCGEHLIKNALGGNRRGLLTSVMSVQPPLARKVRDDISVQVVFFGDYTRPEMVGGEEQAWLRKPGLVESR